MVTAKAIVSDDGMNKTERSYANHLELRRRAGEILRWDFEPEKLRLADRTFITVDFRVILPDGTVEFHDTKGSKGAGYFVREDAAIKLKLAAALHPYRFFVAWYLKGRGWQTKRIGPGDGETNGSEKGKS